MKVPAERVLASSLIRALMRQRLRGARLILAYHGIVPDGARSGGERALFISQRAFGRQLDYIASEADVVSLQDLYDEGGARRPRVAVTFDDAYRGAVVNGVDELVRRRLPATFFVAPGRLGGHVFWWDALAEPNGALDAGVRTYALDALAGDDERVREWARATGMSAVDSVPAHARSATFGELRSAMERPGMSIGSHTWSHANLARLSKSEVSHELARTRLWLQQRFGDRSIPWLAYPYGMDSPDARQVATELGYVGALRIAGGWHRDADAAPLGRPRLNVSAGISLSGFAARMNGVVRT